MNLSPDNRIAGVLVPLFALRGENDLGVGDVSALREFIDWIAGIGFKLVQLLPINETGSDNSPYNAISAMAIEPTTLYLGPDSPEDLTRQDVDFALGEVVPSAAKRADASTPLRTSLSKLRRGGVKYRLVKKLKRRLLEKAFANFSAAECDRPSERISWQAELYLSLSCSATLKQASACSRRKRRKSSRLRKLIWHGSIVSAVNS